MAKEPRATDSTTAPKKRTRKSATEAEIGTTVTKAAKSGSKPNVINELAYAADLEERIRIRAYELYLQRGGNGGSPEQDWFQAVAEVYGHSVA
jgi:hypothetical protein